VSCRYDLIAEAIAANLNDADDGTFAEAFDAAARYVVHWELKELQNAVRVSVTPRSAERSIDTRSSDRIELTIDVAIQTRCVPQDAARVAELVTLVDQIERHLNRGNIETDDVAALWRSSQIDPLYDAEWLHERRVFMSVITLQYLTFQDNAGDA
jgi:hypothetical protein